MRNRAVNRWSRAPPRATMGAQLNGLQAVAPTTKTGSESSAPLQQKAGAREAVGAPRPGIETNEARRRLQCESGSRGEGIRSRSCS